MKVRHRPRLLSDNGSSYIAGDLAEGLENHGMAHIRDAPRHPQTQGKIERWRQTMKNRILLEHYYLPGALEAQVGTFVEHYNQPITKWNAAINAARRRLADQLNIRTGLITKGGNRSFAAARSHPTRGAAN